MYGDNSGGSNSGVTIVAAVIKVAIVGEAIKVALTVRQIADKDLLALSDWLGLASKLG